MSSRLIRMQNLPELARETNWSVAALARRIGVSVRVLERYALRNLGKSPKVWLVEQRQQKARELLSEGCSIKEAAAQLGYRHAHHFSREFKAHWGCCPSALVASNKLTPSNRRNLV